MQGAALTAAQAACRTRGARGAPVGQVPLLPVQNSGGSQAGSLGAVVLRHMVVLGLNLSMGHDGLVPPRQYSGTSQVPLAARQTLVVVK